MSPNKACTAAVIVTLLSLTCDNAFEPLLDACADEMATVRGTFVNTPSREQRTSLANGRLAVIWDIGPQPGAGLYPSGVAFLWSADTPDACTVCYSSDPCWPQ